MQRTIRVRVEVDADSAAEGVVAGGLRSWRRRGVRADGKPDWPHQGASKVVVFHAPSEAVAELERLLAGTSFASVVRL